jgi:hypothetical protein
MYEKQINSDPDVYMQMIYNETPEKAYIPIISHVCTKDITITAMIIYIDEREREREVYRENRCFRGLWR